MDKHAPDETLTQFMHERNAPLPLPEGEEALCAAILSLPVTQWLTEVASTAIDLEGVLAVGFLKDICQRADLGKRMLKEWVDKYMDGEFDIDGYRLHFYDAKLDVVIAMIEAIINRKSKLEHPKIEASLNDYYSSM